MRVAVWLTERVEPCSFLLPVVHPAERFVEIIHQDAVEEVLSLEPIFVNQRCSTFAMLDLHLCVAPEADIFQPLCIGEKLRYLRRDQAGIQALIEVHPKAKPYYLFYLLQSVVGGQNIVIHKSDIRATTNRYFFNIHVRRDASFFLRYDAPFALVGASACQESVACLPVY